MKKILFLFIVMTMLSCDKDETGKESAMEEEFYERVEGYYMLRVAKTDPPIDLNLDGVSHADLYKEIVYCNNSLNLNSFSCGFQHKPTYYSSIVFDVPASQYIGPEAGIDTCLRDAELAYDFQVNAKTNEVMLVQSDYWDDFAAGFHTEILDLDWENDRAYFTLRKRFRISPEETKWVILYLEYEKVLEEY